MEWDEVAQLLTGLASMATVTPSGGPHVAVVSPVVIDGSIWIGTNRSSQKASNLLAHPSAALMWSGDAETYLWGDTELVDDIEVKRSMWDDTWPYDPASFFSSPDDPDYVLIRITPRRATIVRFGEDGLARSRWSA